MKLPIIVPGMLRTTQGMRTGPETSAAAPCDLLPDLQHLVDCVGCPEDVVCGTMTSKKSSEKCRK